MDLRQLEILCAIAETGTFTGAGEKLHVSQSAISRQVLLLEDELSIFDGGRPAVVEVSGSTERRMRELERADQQAAERLAAARSETA